MKVYVGRYEFRPSGVGELPEEFRRLHPLDVPQRLAEFPDAWWTNNPYFLDGLPPEQVCCCSARGQRLLSEHPAADKWLGLREMTTGEFWSFIGEDWF